METNFFSGGDHQLAEPHDQLVSLCGPAGRKWQVQQAQQQSKEWGFLDVEARIGGERPVPFVSPKLLSNGTLQVVAM